MKIFKDRELKEEVIGDLLSLGKIEAGDTKEYTFYIYNDSDFLVTDLGYSLISADGRQGYKELNIINAPKELKSKESDKLVISWESTVSLKEGIKAKLEIKLTENWE